jgi:hypothetical protein
MVKQWVLNVKPEPGSQEPDIISLPEMPNSPTESDRILGDNSDLESDESEEESSDTEHPSNDSEQESNATVDIKSDIGTCTDPYASSADNSSYYDNGPAEGDGYDFVERDPPVCIVSILLSQVTANVNSRTTSNRNSTKRLSG